MPTSLRRTINDNASDGNVSGLEEGKREHTEEDKGKRRSRRRIRGTLE